MEQTSQPKGVPHLHIQLTFNRGAKNSYWVSDKLLNKWHWKSWISTCRQMKSYPKSIPATKIHSKQRFHLATGRSRCRDPQLNIRQSSRILQKWGRFVGPRQVGDITRTWPTESTKRGSKGLIETKVAITQPAQICASSSVYAILQLFSLMFS